MMLSRCNISGTRATVFVNGGTMPSYIARRESRIHAGENGARDVKITRFVVEDMNGAEIFALPEFSQGTNEWGKSVQTETTLGHALNELRKHLVAKGVLTKKAPQTTNSVADALTQTFELSA